MKKLILCVISLLLAFSLAACDSVGFGSDVKGSGIVTKGKKLPSASDAVMLSPNDSPEVAYEQVAENESFKLWYDKNNCAVRLTDISGEKVWDSIIDYKSKDLKLSAVWKQNVSSMFEINFSHPNENGRERIVSASVRKLKLTAWSEVTQNGINILYYFPDRKLGFEAQFRLNEKGFTVNIPAESVIENGEYRFVSINILPFFSAVDAGENGYILSPYSNGALLSFSKETEGKYIQLPIYSESNPEPWENTKLNPQSNSEKYSDSNICSLPIFGMTDTRKGFVAYADEYGEDSYINISTAYYGIPYNRASFCWYIRNVTTLNFSANDGTSGTADILDDDIIPTDKKVCYDLLGEGNCDYNAMAQSYREHLLSKGWLKKNSKADADISVEILMGVPRKEIAGNTLVKTTTFEQAEKIIEKLGEKGVKNALINLKGWNKNGYGATPTEAKVAGELGGMNDLKKLAQLCEKLGYKLCLEAQLTELNTDFSNLSAKKTSVVDNNGFYISNSNENIYFQRLSVIKGGVKDLFKRFSDSGISGINFGGFGSHIYRDYNEKVTYASDFSKGITEMLKETGKNFETVAVRGSNLYAMLNSDYVYDVNVPFSGNITYSEYVPFLQLVMGNSTGLITNPVNSFYSPEIQRLMLLEYGAIPNFELTYESVYSLQDTQYNTLFSAKFDLWLDTIAEQYGIMSGDVGALRNSRPIKHEKLADGVTMMTYDNGKKLLINKNKNDFVYSDITVPSCDFTVLN